MPAPSEAPASPSRPHSPPSTRFTPPTPTAAPAQPSPSPSTKRSREYGQKRARHADGPRGRIRIERCASNLFGRLVLPETLQAITQAPLQRRGGVGIESHEIPERLAAIPAWSGQRRSIRVGVPRHIFANRAIWMLRQLIERLGIVSRMLADQAQQIKILFRRLLHKFLQHFRLGIGA